jgi:hypothetical protein
MPNQEKSCGRGRRRQCGWNPFIGKRLEEAVAEYRRSLPAAVEEVEQWVGLAKKALAENAALPAPPKFPLHPNVDRSHRCRIQSLYNGMVHPLTLFAIRGAIWYQGENNGSEIETVGYRVLQGTGIETEVGRIKTAHKQVHRVRRGPWLTETAKKKSRTAGCVLRDKSMTTTRVHRVMVNALT